MVDIASLYRDFSKPELLKICKELELTAQPTENTRKLVDKIVTDIETNGLPEPSQSSKLLFEFMLTGEWIDAKGQVPEEGLSEEEIEVIPTDADQEECTQELSKPTCFSLHDDRDPACRKCKVAADCAKARISSRPACYGKLFDNRTVECQACIEAVFCNQIKQEGR